jgi:hypothetical protein
MMFRATARSRRTLRPSVGKPQTARSPSESLKTVVIVRTLPVAVLLAALGLPTALHAQSLADVAKKTEEERATAKQEQVKTDKVEKAEKATDKANTPTKVYTNKDLDSRPAPEPGVASKAAETPPKAETPAATTAKRDAELDAEVTRLKGRAALKRLQTAYHEFQRFVEKEGGELNAFNCGTVNQRLAQGDTCYERAAKLKFTYPDQLRRTRQAIWDLAVELKLNPEQETR